MASLHTRFPGNVRLEVKQTSIRSLPPPGYPSMVVVVTCGRGMYHGPDRRKGGSGFCPMYPSVHTWHAAVDNGADTKLHLTIGKQPLAGFV